MSWFARSIANSLKLDDDHDDDDEVGTAKPEPKPPENPHLQNDDASSPNYTPRGVKDDLSDISKTLTRQFWGVASFLAPPPQQQRQDPEIDESDPYLMSGIRSDFAEIGGKFKSGISRLSNNINVSEITKMASDFLQLGSDDEGEEKGSREEFDSVSKGAPGVNEGVVTFARDISMHPETWLDFPLPENVEDDVDFDMSDAQQEHALAVEQVAPRLTALRIELCPGYMSERRFWKIYFVLLHPRLDKHDAEFLSTPQIVKARALLAQELQIRTSATPEGVGGGKHLDQETKTGSQKDEPLSVPTPVLSGNDSYKASYIGINSSNTPMDSETVKLPVKGDELQAVEKSLVKEKATSQSADKSIKSGSSNILGEKDEDDADDWLKEDSSEIVTAPGVSIPIENEEDVSFSDLEEDDGDLSTNFKKSSDSFKKDSPEWVQLRKSSSDSSKDMVAKHSDKENVNAHDTKESNDWLDVDDIDVA